MTMKSKLLLLLALIFAYSSAYAQDTREDKKTITGTVTSGEDAYPMPGVTVTIKGTTTGTVTDVHGEYSLEVPDTDAVLVFSFVGYDNKEVVVGEQSVIDVVLEPNIKDLEEVVVTALGVKRNVRTLGYSVQEVKSKTIQDAGTPNVVDAMTGKAAGVQVTRSSGTAGGGSRIVIRGVTSMVGNNQPLIILDGIRINNETNYPRDESRQAGTAQSNRLSDLNTEDIASISVLKGAAATALYGTAGSTGVVIITTKKGAKAEGKAFDVSFVSRMGFDRVSTLPNLQEVYAQGSGGVYRDPSTGSSTSWGPKISELSWDGNSSYKWDKNGAIVPNSSSTASKPVTPYDNLGTFFQTGYSFNNSLSVSGGGEKATFRFSYSNHDETGIIPNNTYKRNSFFLSSQFKAIENLTLDVSANYTRSDYVRVQQGSNTSGIMLGLLRTPPTFDNSNGFDNPVDSRSAYQFLDGSQRNYRGGGGYDNPYWIVNNALRNENVDRTILSFSAAYNFSQWANLTFKVGKDFTSDERKQNFDLGTRTASNGRVIEDTYTTNQLDAYLQLGGSGDLSSTVKLNYFVGMNAFNYRFDNYATTGNGLAIPNFVNLSNAATVASRSTIDRYRTLGIYGQVEVSYNEMLYLTLTGRQDYDTRLRDPAKDFKASDLGFFYPSASLSFVFSELLALDFLSFGKARVSYARVGAGPPSSYSTSTIYQASTIGDGWGDRISYPIGGATSFGLFSILGNPELTPEFSTTLEYGLDLRFLEGKIGLDIAYYNRKTTDAILNASLAHSSGYENVWLNAAELTSDGLEITVNANPIRKDNWYWDFSLNFTSSKSVIDELAPGVEQLQIGGFTGSGIYLVKGQQYGSIFGGAYLRAGAGREGDDGLSLPSGELVIQDDPTKAEYGYQIPDQTLRAIGNSNPKFILGFKNNLRYKNFNLSFFFDWKNGGDLWNGTAWALTFFGASELTEQTRVEQPAPIKGVKASDRTTPNDIPIVRGQSYWQSSVGGFGSVDEQFVQDASWIRLRELSLTYTFNPKVFDKTFIEDVRIGVVGRNLWYSTPYDGIDPETSLTGTGNAQGLNYFNNPSTRSYMFQLNVQF